MRLSFFILCCFIASDLLSQTDSLRVKNPIDSGYISSFDGQKIYYESRGSGKAVLLVHGFIVDGASWKRTASYTDLLKSGYKVIVPDLRGNGRSDKSHDSTAYENDAEAKDLMLLMDHLKVQQYVVLGYSRGSIITARLLALDTRVHAAVLGGMGDDFTNPQWPRRISFFRALMGENVPELKGAVDYIQGQGLDQLALAYLQRAQPSTSKEILHNIQQPILVICGDKDSDNGSASALSKLFIHSSLATVPGDHGHASGTREFSNETIAFLKAVHY
jgi:pimeloyl-ACP methyl ester carboxylesterase